MPPVYRLDQPVGQLSDHQLLKVLLDRIVECRQRCATQQEEITQLHEHLTTEQSNKDYHALQHAQLTERLADLERDLGQVRDEYARLEERFDENLAILTRSERDRDEARTRVRELEQEMHHLTDQANLYLAQRNNALDVEQELENQRDTARLERDRTLIAERAKDERIAELEQENEALLNLHSSASAEIISTLQDQIAGLKATQLELEAALDDETGRANRNLGSVKECQLTIERLKHELEESELDGQMYRDAWTVANERTRSFEAELRILRGGATDV